MIGARYETSSGETFDLSGQASRSGLSGNEYKGWELTRSGRAFERQRRSVKATMSFAGETSEARERAMRLFELCDLDALSQSPGRLWVGDWYLECYVSAGDCSYMWPHGVSYDVTLACDEMVWRRETVTEFMPWSASTIVNDQLDYSYDYPHDYGMTASLGGTIDVPGTEPCDFRITVYGYAASPYVRIGGNVYQVNVTVPDGGLLTIDSTRRKSMAGDAVVVRDMYGNATNAFPKRLRGYEGSGTYIFQRVSPGRNDVSWPQGFGFSLTLIERRGRLPWT